MSTDAFTAGIEYGGLTTSPEVRMLICWLLHKTNESLPISVLNDALQQDALVNYFELVNGVTDLLSTGHLVEGEHEANTEAPLILTDLGRQTAITFEKKIPLTVREKSLEALRMLLKRRRAEQENHTEIKETPDGWQLSLQIADVRSDLLNLTLFAPSEELCLHMRDRFLSDPAKLYTTIADYLSDGKLK